MADLFRSSRCKIDWAKHHISNLEARIAAFIDERPYEKIIEADSEPGYNCHKVRLTKLLPTSFALIMGDAVNNLRAALDHIGYASAIANRVIAPKHCAFPFAKNAAQFPARANGMCRDIPKEIVACFHAFQPYGGGNITLWALNEACNADKHFLLTPVCIGTIGFVRSGPTGGRVRLSTDPFWDRTKNELSLFIAKGNPEYDFNMSFKIAFESPEILKNKEVITTLNGFADEVERVLMAIEAEARRIGLTA